MAEKINNRETDYFGDYKIEDRFSVKKQVQLVYEALNNKNEGIIFLGEGCEKVPTKPIYPIDSFQDIKNRVLINLRDSEEYKFPIRLSGYTESRERSASMIEKLTGKKLILSNE